MDYLSELKRFHRLTIRERQATVEQLAVVEKRLRQLLGETERANRSLRIDL